MFHKWTCVLIHESTERLCKKSHELIQKLQGEFTVYQRSQQQQLSLWNYVKLIPCSTRKVCVFVSNHIQMIRGSHRKKSDGTVTAAGCWTLVRESPHLPAHLQTLTQRLNNHALQSSTIKIWKTYRELKHTCQAVGPGAEPSPLHLMWPSRANKQSDMSDQGIYE